jgi:predicted nucleic acid-binding protein
VYFDSNIFIFAAIDKGKVGKNCRKIMEFIDEQRILAAANYMVIDEVLWVLKKNIGKEDAIRIVKGILSMPIKWIDIDKQIIIETMVVFEKTSLDPRDSVHIASMKKVGLTTMVSEDRDFDKIVGIVRKNSLEFLREV